MKRLRNPKKLSFVTQNMIPTIGFPKWAKIQVCQFQFILHSFGKMTIMFSTNLVLRQFKWHLKANTLKYLPTQNHNFPMDQSLPVWLWTLSCLLEIFSHHCFGFYLSFFTQILKLNHSLKACKQVLVHPNIIQNHHTQIYLIIICNEDHFSI